MDVPRVLIVSHEMREYRFFELMMFSWNVEVEWVENSLFVIHKMKEKRYDAVILDIFSSEIHDSTLVVRIKNAFKDVKIILMCSNENKKYLTRYLKYGVFDILEKPIIPEIINNSLRKALDFKMLEIQYRRSLEEIRQKNKEMMEMDETLSELTKTIEKIQRLTERKIIQQIRTLIMPIIEHLQHDTALKTYEPQLERLTGYLEEIIAGSVTNLEVYGGLSRREIQMALMIRDGMTNEEIAAQLHISSETVKVHRRNIRKKLGIAGTKNRLNVYLHSLKGQSIAEKYV